VPTKAMMPDHEPAALHEPVLGGREGVDHCILPLAVPVAQVASDSWEQAAAPDSLKSLQKVKLEAETNAIVATLQKTGWNRKAAARMLKVSYRTLLYKIERYHLRASDAPQLRRSRSLPETATASKAMERGSEWIKPVEPPSE